MTTDEARAAIEAFIDAWIRTAVAGDAEAAAQLRATEYTAIRPDGEKLGREAELAFIRSGGWRPTRMSGDGALISIGNGGRTATAELILEVSFDGNETAAGNRYRCQLDLVREEGAWKARTASVEDLDALGSDRPAGLFRRTLRRLLPERLRHGLKALAGQGESRFQGNAYLPFQEGQSFLLPPIEERDPDGALPIPPKALWLGYDYPKHGRQHVETMMRAVEDTGLTFQPGDRILDLGCGAGRMIRHLEPLAGTCEIWGTDISAEHIFWCKRNLSPPFNFATTTKVPALPFEDRSFKLIYCGSLFTHIDDLADAWLLELHRILAPEGRLYVTIHDQHTMRLLDEPEYSWSWLAREFKAHPIFAEAQSGFGMFALGRGHESQIFYERSFFAAMTDRMFETVATHEEAYFHQTAIVLKRRTRLAPDA